MIEGTEFIDLTLGGGGSGGGGGSSAASEWIAKDKTIFAYPTTLTGGTTVDISDYLPAGATGQYEVLAVGGQSSGNLVINTGVVREYAGMESTTKVRSEFVLVIDADNPTFTVDVYTTCTNLGINFKAYRKVNGVDAGITSDDWVAKYLEVHNGSVASGTQNWSSDMSTYLPDDGQQYEVLCEEATFGNVDLRFDTDFSNDMHANYDNSSNVIASNFMLIFGSTRKLSLRAYNSMTNYILRFIAYRKVTGVDAGSGTFNYNDLMNKPKINNVNLKGNKSSSDFGLQDALVSGTNIKTINSTSLLGSGDVAVQETLVSGTNIKTINSTSLLGSGDISITSDVTDVQFNGVSVVTSGVANITNSNIRSVAPACTTITASDTTATLTANSTYCHKPSASGCTYTISTPTDTSTVYNGFILQIDTENSASIAFATDGTPSATISLNGNVTPATGKKYTVTGQWDTINSIWQLFIIDYSAS